ncbi:MAG: hypothetical protein GEU96_19150 [Propionibacteriales bacterium]|nr:hypothetical protein [Propionibacteriales bacterium]
MTDLAIVDVSDWEVRIPEPGGSDANVWLFDPETEADALFKPVVAKAGRRQGEDWAEKVVEQVAALIGVPSARIRMATRNGHPGLLSYDLAPAGHELQTGAVLIGEIDGRLVPRAKERLGHNLANIHTVLAPRQAVGMPDRFTAFDQFCGYLVMDALVANRDRHEENWGVLRDPDGRVTLAPSYDHGNSLGFNLLDNRRLLELGRDPELERWASRGFADRFEASRDMTLVEFAHRALAMARPGTGAHWLGRLAHVVPTAWETVVNSTPEMSEACRTFCVRLVTTNQRRLLDGV